MIDRLKAILAFCRHYWAVAFFGINVVVLITVALVYVVYAKSAYFESPIHTGQRVIINVETQKVTGGIPVSKSWVAHSKVSQSNPSALPNAASSQGPEGQAAKASHPLTSPATVEVLTMPQASSIINSEDKKPSISVLIVDLGLSKSSTELAFQLPSFVGFGFSPYSSQLEEWVTKAKISGHSIWLRLPLQTVHYPADDPGPYGLLTMLSEQQNLSRLEWILGRTPLLNGLYSSEDEVFSQTEANIAPVLAYLKSHNIMYLSSNENNKTLDTIVSKNSFLVIDADRIIDKTVTEKSIRTSLAEAIELTKQFGHVTIVGHAYPLTINIVKEWLESEKQNTNFVALQSPNQLPNQAQVATPAAVTTGTTITASPATHPKPANVKIIDTHYVKSTTVKP